jgi:hypothetical protein
MALATSGEMSIGGSTANRSINVEFGRSATATTSMSQLYRGGGIITTNNTSVPTSGEISISNFYGASNRIPVSYTFSASAANSSLNVTTIGGYTAGVSDITITVNAGVYLYSTGTGTPGLTLTGGASGDTITLVNNGLIMGMGGGGGLGGPASNGSSGGIALQLGYPTTVNNTSPAAYIGGGGGGGGSGGNCGGGGGAGAGAGGTGIGPYSTAGGAGGGLGAAGSPAPDAPTTAPGGYGRGGGAGGGGGNAVSAGRAVNYYGGGGGGRIFPGTGGASGGPAAGAGGSSNNGGGSSPSNGGGGGGWGASGGSTPSRSGGTGGKAVNLNGQSITWVSGDTTRVYGAVS